MGGIVRILNLISAFLIFSVCAYATVDNSEIFSYVARGDADTVRGWVISGGNLNIQDAKGNTALILAAEDGHVEMVSILLNNGADVNVTNSFGYTALWTAVSGRHPLIISALIAAGADSSIKNIYGSSVDDYVKALGFKDVFSYAISLPPSRFKAGPNSTRHIPLWEKKADSLLAQNLFTDAEYVLKAVADNGDRYARYRLGKLYLDSGYMDLAVIYLTSAADMDVLPAQIALSSYYFDTADRHPVYSALGFKYQKMAADNAYPPAVL